MRVLVVEGDAPLGLFLKRSLNREGLETECTDNGLDAVRLTRELRPELVVLDLDLVHESQPPDGLTGLQPNSEPSSEPNPHPTADFLRLDGTATLQAILAVDPVVSVLALTSCKGVDERVRCLNLGADDCLLKPFSFFELGARCKAILRRRTRFANPVLRVGEIEMDRLSRRVTHEGRVVELTTREYALLEALLRSGGRCCSRTDLLQEVWGGTPEVGTNVVDVYITYLRRKLGVAGPGANPGDSVIETVRGLGFRVRASRLEAQPQPPLEVRAQPTEVPTATNRTSVPRFGPRPGTAAAYAPPSLPLHRRTA